MLDFVEVRISRRRAHARVQELVARRPSDRVQWLLFKSERDIEALRALTDPERERADAHWARVAAEA